MSKYLFVAGLETHVELQTDSKIFCGCSTKFGAEPNTHTCPVCTGEPGSLPIINKKVLEYAIRAGLATHGKISAITTMDRKNYVYPDLPKAYQISQFENPVSVGGYVELDSGKRIRLNHIHMEEDAGKSDCKMQEGSMRCDVNISVHLPGTPFGTRTEIKNMNSVSFMEKALAYEYARQCDLLDSGEKVVQETRRYNEGTQTTESMRSKEDAQDYRYFPEPDILAIRVSDEFIESIKKQMPVLPAELKRAFLEKGIGEVEADRLVEYKRVADFYAACIEKADAKIAANLILGEIFRSMQTEEEKERFEIPFDAEAMIELVNLRSSGKINSGIQKRVLNEMLSKGGKPSDYLTKEDMASVDDSVVDGLCREAIAANERAVRDYLNGKEQALKALLGYVMKATRGKADSAAVEGKLKELLAK